MFAIQVHSLEFERAPSVHALRNRNIFLDVSSEGQVPRYCVELDLGPLDRALVLAIDVALALDVALAPALALSISPSPLSSPLPSTSTSPALDVALDLACPPSPSS